VPGSIPSTRAGSSSVARIWTATPTELDPLEAHSGGAADGLVDRCHHRRLDGLLGAIRQRNRGFDQSPTRGEAEGGLEDTSMPSASTARSVRVIGLVHLSMRAAVSRTAPSCPHASASGVPGAVRAGRQRQVRSATTNPTTAAVTASDAIGGSWARARATGATTGRMLLSFDCSLQGPAIASPSSPGKRDYPRVSKAGATRSCQGAPPRCRTDDTVAIPTGITSREAAETPPTPTLAHVRTGSNVSCPTAAKRAERAAGLL
jgi:hypothetical protein